MKNQIQRKEIYHVKYKELTLQFFAEVYLKRYFLSDKSDNSADESRSGSLTVAWTHWF